MRATDRIALVDGPWAGLPVTLDVVERERTFAGRVGEYVCIGYSAGVWSYSWRETPRPAPAMRQMPRQAA